MKLENASHSGHGVETRVKTKDSADSPLLHHGEMDGVPCRKVPISKNNLLGFFDGCQINRDDLINDPQNRVKSGLDRVKPLDGDITVQDFLQHFRVGHQGLAIIDESLQSALHITFVGVSRPTRFIGMLESIRIKVRKAFRILVRFQQA